MILLSDKEIGDLLDEGLNLPIEAIIFGRDVAKAQAEKDFGWLAGFPWRNNKDSTTSIRIPSSELSAALDEVKHD